VTILRRKIVNKWLLLRLVTISRRKIVNKWLFGAFCFRRVARHPSWHGALR
jgi:hypothetical protein